MKLISVELENFRQHRATKLEFSAGVTAIVGPNGSGKTTLLEAIAWALYGSSAIRENNSTVRSFGAASNSKVNVSLTFEFSGQRYTVKRRMEAGSNTTSAQLEVDYTIVSRGQKDVTAMLTKLLGMDYRAFFNSFFTGQKELDFMGNMEAGTRAAAVSRMLGYERITKARENAVTNRRKLDANIEGLTQGMGEQKEIKERLKSAKERLTRSASDLKDAEKTYRQCNETLENILPELRKIEVKKENSERLAKSIEKLYIEQKHAKIRIDDYAKQIQNLDKIKHEKQQLEPQIAEIAAMAEEFRKLRKNLKHEERRKQIKTTLSLLGSDIESLTLSAEKLRVTTEQLNAAQARLTQTQQQEAATRKKMTELSDARIAALNTARAKRDSCTAQILKLRSKLQEIELTGEEGKCPTCERPLAGELNVVLSGFEMQIGELSALVKMHSEEAKTLERPSAEYNRLDRELKNLGSELAQLQKQVSEKEAQLQDCIRAAQSIKEKRAHMKNLHKELVNLPQFDSARYEFLFEYGQRSAGVRARYASIAESLEGEAKTREEYAQLQNHIAKLSSEQKKLTKDNEELNFDIKGYKSISESCKLAQSALTEARVALERFKAENESAKQLYERSAADEERYNIQSARLAQARQERLHLHTLHTVLDSFRSELNTRIRPDLESAAGEMLAEITDGRYNLIELDEDYKVRIRDDNEIKQVISGGEQDVVNLALRLAVSQMIADRAGRSMSLLILDEVFGSLDEQRRDNLVALLQNIKRCFEQIIIITHIESIHNAVDNTVWVEFDEQSKTSTLKAGPDLQNPPIIE